jgi:hypothetical protein
VGATTDAVEHENRAVDAGLSKLDPFLGKRNTKAVDAFGLQPLSDGNHAVPIRVGFHHREHLAPLHRAPHYLQVVPDRVEQDLGTRRP